jgi:hypothetical protein
MSHPVLIEVAGEDAGIIAPIRGGYVFYAASPRFRALEGRTFGSAAEAHKTARIHFLRRRGRERRDVSAIQP